MLQNFIEVLEVKVGKKCATMNILTSREINEIVEDQMKGTVVVEIDCSYKDEFSTTAWIIENESETQKLVGRFLCQDSHLIRVLIQVK